MKKKTIRRMTSTKEIEDTVYVCEGCGAELDFPQSIGSCELCGKEICAKCRAYAGVLKDRLQFEENSTLLMTDSDDDRATFEDVSTQACRGCAKQSWARYDAYVKCVQALVNSFNENLDKLNDKYFKNKL